MKRVVIDTNIIVSGTSWQGTPLQILKAAEAKQYAALTSDDLIAELHSTLSKPKFARVIAEFRLASQDVVALYLSYAEKVSSAELPQDAVRDIEDVPVLACAVGGQADIIVSGDKDLLTRNTAVFVF